MPPTLSGDTGDDTRDDDTAGEDDTDSTDDRADESPNGFDGEVDGTWTIDPDAGENGSEAGFRVNEELASVGASTAVGRIPGVEGSLTIEGTTVTAVDVTVDLTQLESNDSRRDDRMHEALETHSPLRASPSPNRSSSPRCPPRASPSTSPPWGS